MKTAIVGSRTFRDYARLTMAMEGMEVTTVISGGASGADTLAERWARDNQKPLLIIPADWALHGKKAGMIRNAAIVQQADIVIALWDGQSPGTRATIRMAGKAGKPVRVIRF
jgi:hypothetical protein